MPDRERRLLREVLAELPATDRDPAGQRVVVVDLLHFAGRGHTLSACVHEVRGGITSFTVSHLQSKRLDGEARFSAKRLHEYNVAPETLKAIRDAAVIAWESSQARERRVS